MKVSIYRCPEEDCDAAFLTREALKGHSTVHQDLTTAEEAFK